MKLFATLFLLILATAAPVRAQDRVWVQIEAHPTLREAEERARAYGGLFPDVGAFQLSSGWYGIAIGPYGDENARLRLLQLRREGMIPADSFVSDGSDFRRQVWPIGAAQEPPTTSAEPPQAAQPPAGAAALSTLPEETPAEARRAEYLLSRDERDEVQRALQWAGYYDSGIDGAFGPGTRRAMADWQAARGYESTGILTTRQRAELVGGYRAELSRLGMRPVDESEAGIRINMPLGLVEFDRYEPPFVHYKAREDSGVRALLISERGDQTTLYGLYDVMQTLAIVPLQGERSRNTREFTLTGKSATLHSYTYARLTDGMIKGFTLAWRPADDKLMQRAALMMRESLESVPGVALDATMSEASAEQRADMLSGLEIRKPETTHTGFFVDRDGAVLTAAAGLEGCGRITIGADVEMKLAAREAALGLAVLRPERRLAPVEVARFLTATPLLRSDVAVAGFSYGEVLDLPVLTYGTLADLRGLDGEESVERLEIETLPGDVGGPVLDASGAVLGMLLAPAGGARKLPGNVHYAADATALGAFLSTQGIEALSAENREPLPEGTLTRRAADMTVPVSCWN